MKRRTKVKNLIISHRYFFFLLPILNFKLLRQRTLFLHFQLPKDERCFSILYKVTTRPFPTEARRGQMRPVRREEAIKFFVGAFRGNGRSFFGYGRAFFGKGQRIFRYGGEVFRSISLGSEEERCGE